MPKFLVSIVGLAIGFVFMFSGCDRYRYQDADVVVETAVQPDQEHAHGQGSMGGILTSLGRDEYHIELFMQEDGLFHLFCYAADETQLISVPLQELSGYVNAPDQSATILVLKPEPFPNDPAGSTSRFVARLPERFLTQTLRITVPGITMGEQRYTARFAIDRSAPPTMPTAIASDQAAELYLTSGGRYTAADIIANGSITAAEKYRGFVAQHDPNPSTGDPICPITQTLANPDCSWIIDGQTYTFCCPPCIDEFLTLAKTSPEEVSDANDYRQR